MEKLQQALASGSFDWSNDEFFDSFGIEDGSFLAQETTLYDYKKDWPFSYSDKYFVHIAKLISAFANTSGGLVIFGVDDSTKRARRGQVVVNIDRMCQALSQILSVQPTIKHKRFTSDHYGTVDVLAVFPFPPMSLPARFTRTIEDATSGSFWIRSGHETIQATTRHIPLLFCRDGLNINRRPTDSAIPPPPTTIRQFVGRLDTIYDVFDWLYKSRHPRNFLYGKGGSGKTSIAYEVARHIADAGDSVFLAPDRPVDSVIFLSAKATALNVIAGSPEHFLGRDFSTAKELYQAILILTHWSSEEDMLSKDEDALLADIQSLLDTFSLIIVIDDIDTLTTRGSDGGMEQLYLAIARARAPSKILYTLRNAPTHSLSNAIEVKGLSDKEYDEFVDVCAKQFKVDPPTGQIRISRLKEVSERRPLIIETIIALRRNSSNYDQAIQLFELHAGDNARDYVFKREWDALPSDNRARYLLTALALLNEECVLDDLTAMLQYNEELVAEALGAAREMFLEISVSGEETAFRLGPLTRSFVLAESRRLDRFHVISERVKAYKRSVFPEKPHLSRLRLRTDRLIRLALAANSTDELARAWALVSDPSLAPDITEDPRYRAYLGYVASKMRPPKVAEAREAFGYVFSMKFEPETDFLLAWYQVEKESGHGSENCEKIVDFVSKAKTYSQETKIEFRIIEAVRAYTMGKEARFSDRERAISLLLQSLRIHLRTLRLAIDLSHPKVYRLEEFSRNTAFLLFNTLAGGELFDDMIDVIRKLSGESELFMDPLELPISEYFAAMAAARHPPKVAARLKGRLADLEKRMRQSPNWESAQSRDKACELVSKTAQVL